MYINFGIHCIFNAETVSQNFLMQIKPWHKNTYTASCKNNVAQNNGKQTHWFKNKMETEASKDGFNTKP
jgi:uncharacterized protein (UPF0333 family)